MNKNIIIFAFMLCFIGFTQFYILYRINKINKRLSEKTQIAYNSTRRVNERM